MHTLVLLELWLSSLPKDQEFLQHAGAVFDAYERGDHEGALAIH